MADATMATNDDELEQNWAPQAVAVSDDEEVVSAGSEDEFEGEQDLELAPAKRAREEPPAADAGEKAQDDDTAATAQKKQKTDGVAASTKAASAKAANAKGLHKMTAAEHFQIVNAVWTRHKGGPMTSLELAQGLNETHFAAPKGLGKHKLELLPAYLYGLMPAWKKEFVGKGKRQDKSPYFIILSASALRAVEVYKQLSSSLKCRVGKLFARHIKATEQAEQLRQLYFPVAVGTPGRVKKLLEMDALSLRHTRFVLIDMHRDKKQMTILELKDSAKETAELLEFHLLARLNAQQLKLVLY